MVAAMTHRARAALLACFVLLTVGCTTAGVPSSGTASTGAGAVGTGTASRGDPRCTTATQPAPSLPASATAMTKAVPAGSPAGTPPEGSPFGVAIASGGKWAFASLGSALGVLRLSAGRPARLVQWINLPEFTAGAALTPDGRYLLLAGGAGAVVVSVSAAEHGSSQAVLGELSAPGPGGPAEGSAIEVAVSADGRYAFVSLEYADQIAVFDLAAALADGFGGNDGYVGTIPTQVATVGLAVSPDDRWLYVTSEAENLHTYVGTLAVVSVTEAESDPAASVLDRVTAGCEPVRVITSADGSVVWVTARASDALLAFSASRLRTDPAHALLANVRVGEAPVGLALARHGSLMVVADSNRFGASGKAASLAVVDVPDALAGRPALVGYLPAGQFPRDMAASRNGSTVLVTNYDSGQIETVNAAALP
jgi:DNA-binding beta-propeller fold protein YncE